jgi:hypothetical protein
MKNAHTLTEYEVSCVINGEVNETDINEKSDVDCRRLKSVTVGDVTYHGGRTARFPGTYPRREFSTLDGTKHFAITLDND